MGLDNIRIVLVSPLYSGNIGSVCRAMANMGIADLALVAPRPINEDEARMMACHAVPLLNARRTFASLAEAVADCGAVMGASARAGLYRQHARSPREWAPRALELAAHTRVALVFGPEDNGLSVDDLSLCTQIIQIPTTDAYPSLNLAQAVMVCCYELFLAGGAWEPPREKSEVAPSDLRERMFTIWREMLTATGFLHDDMAEHMMLGIRRVLSRGALTVDDVHIMMGVARQTLWASRHRPGSDGAGSDDH